MSDMTAKYVEARIREGPNFDYLRWFRRVQEEEAQAIHVPTTSHLGEHSTREIGDLTTKSNGQDARLSSTSTVMNKGRSNSTATFPYRHEDSKTRLRRRFQRVCDAWRYFQTSRDRDAVYVYLRAVFALVERYNVRRKAKKLLRHAFRSSALPFDRNADPFTAVIRCTCKNEPDNKTISKWARALRYVAHCQVRRIQLKSFMKEAGGVNACANQFARYSARNYR